MIQFIAGHSCIKNNIVNVPAPTLAEYKYFSLSRHHIESTKIHLVESVIIQKKMSRSNAKFNVVNIDDTQKLARVTTDLPATIMHLHNSK